MFLALSSMFVGLFYRVCLAVFPIIFLEMEGQPGRTKILLVRQDSSDREIEWETPNEQILECKIRVRGVYGNSGTVEVYSSLFSISNDADNPFVEVYKVFQTGDRKFHVIAKAIDMESGIKPNSVKLIYNNIEGFSLFGEGTHIMQPIDGAANFFEGIAYEIGPDRFDEGQQVVWRVEASDRAGNVFHYPADLPQIGPHDKDAEWSDYCARIIIHDEEHLDETKNFKYQDTPTGVIKFEQDDDLLKIENNTAIWYTMQAQPSTLEVSGVNLFGMLDYYLLEPRAGIIDWSFLTDYSVHVSNIHSANPIIIAVDRKSTAALILNVWEMVATVLRVNLDVSVDWLKLLEKVEIVLKGMDISYSLAYQANLLLEDPHRTLENAYWEMLDYFASEIVLEAITQVYIAEKQLPEQLVYNMVKGSVQNLFSIILAFNKQSRFLYDIFRLPDDQESITLVREAALWLRSKRYTWKTWEYLPLCGRATCFRSSNCYSTD